MKKLIAEFLGTAWLVLGGCGSAVLAANFADSTGVNTLGLGFLGVSFAFGLTVVTMAYAIGHISGCHLNPAVSVGLWVGGRFDSKDLPGYIAAQVLGGIFGAAILYLIATGNGAEIGGFASNGYGAISPDGKGAHSPGGYSMMAAFVTEVVMTFFFLIVILGTTHKNATPGFAGLAIGLALVLIHLISIPVTNTSVNPARSTSQAIFAGSEYLSQVWLFWVAPIIGAALAGITYKFLSPNDAK